MPFSPGEPLSQQEGANRLHTPTPVLTDPQPADAPKTRWETLVTLTGHKANLATVILAVASKAHVSVELAKGMPDPLVNVEYHSQSAKDILDDLGRVFKFSVLLQTDRRALLVPAVDPNAPKGRPAGLASESPASEKQDSVEITMPKTGNKGQLPPARGKLPRGN